MLIIDKTQRLFTVHINDKMHLIGIFYSVITQSPIIETTFKYTDVDRHLFLCNVTFSDSTATSPFDNKARFGS